MGDFIEIELLHGLTTTVDAEDWPRLSKYKWWASRSYNGPWYVATSKPDETGKHRKMMLHRFILNAPKGVVVDHIDRNPLNNCKSNLRLVSTQQNVRNASRHPSFKTCPYRGVTWRNRKKPYLACSAISGKHVHLGCFTDAAIAAMRYDLHVFQHDPVYAHLNFPRPLIEHIARLEQELHHGR